MERERPIDEQAPAGGGGPEPEGEGVGEVRAEAREILDAVELVLSSITLTDPEQYLQRNRQRGGE
jgi:hypothetical protein